MIEEIVSWIKAAAMFVILIVIATAISWIIAAIFSGQIWSILLPNWEYKNAKNKRVQKPNR